MEWKVAIFVAGGKDQLASNDGALLYAGLTGQKGGIN